MLIQVQNNPNMHTITLSDYLLFFPILTVGLIIFIYNTIKSVKYIVKNKQSYLGDYRSEVFISSRINCESRERLLEGRFKKVILLVYADETKVIIEPFPLALNRKEFKKLWLNSSKRGIGDIVKCSFSVSKNYELKPTYAISLSNYSLLGFELE